MTKVKVERRQVNLCSPKKAICKRNVRSIRIWSSRLVSLSNVHSWENTWKRSIGRLANWESFCILYRALFSPILNTCLRPACLKILFHGREHFFPWRGQIFPASLSPFFFFLPKFRLSAVVHKRVVLPFVSHRSHDLHASFLRMQAYFYIYIHSSIYLFYLCIAPTVSLSLAHFPCTQNSVPPFVRLTDTKWQSVNATSLSLSPLFLSSSCAYIMHICIRESNNTGPKILQRTRHSITQDLAQFGRAKWLISVTSSCEILHQDEVARERERGGGCDLNRHTFLVVALCRSCIYNILLRERLDIAERSARNNANLLSASR